MDKLIIEASINESARKEDNPHVPYGPEEGAREGIASAKAGAAIVHYHARDPVSGENLWERGAAMYLECYRLIREECPDVIVYPTQRGYRPEDTAHLRALALDPAEGLELATVDVLPADGVAGDDSSAMAAFMRELRALNVRYSVGVRHLGHMRHVARYRELGLIDDPLVLKIFWNERSLGPPPGVQGLRMYLDLAPPGMACQWFNTVYDGVPGGRTLRRTSLLAAAAGGHVRTGIGENPMLDGKRGAAAYTNADHVEMAAEMGRLAGRGIATPDEARAILGMPPRGIGMRPQPPGAAGAGRESRRARRG